MKDLLAIPVRIPKMTKLPSQHSMSDHHRHASKNAIISDDGPLMVLFGSSLKKKTKKKKKKRCKVGPPLANLSGSAHESNAVEQA